MKEDIIERFKQLKEKTETTPYTGKDRRKEDDPTHFGHFSLDGLERRKSESIFS